MFDYTKKAKKLIDVFCQTEGRRLNSDVLVPEHMFLAILRDKEAAAMKILSALGVNSAVLRKKIEQSLVTNGSSIIIGSIPHSKRFNKILEYASEECRKLNKNFIGTEHILLALFKFQNIPVIQDLINSGINYNIIKEEIISSNSGQSAAGHTIKRDRKKINVLEEYSYDLTSLAEEGKLDPVIGRTIEVQRVIQILCRKTKNNPVLIGEAGVGKTAVAEGLAQRIISGELPEPLNQKRILSLDMPGIVAGTKYRGEFEDRLKKILSELKKRDDAIVFIDEIHTIMGAGAAEGAIDAANILKPFLARGELQCIGATTLEEYRKYIEKDSALERRFQTVQINEPSVDETVLILEGLRDSYEKHHLVNYSDESILFAAKYSNRYISERYLPDKAIDILDEAGSRARLKNTSKPEELSLLQEEIETLTEEKKYMVQIQEFERAAEIRDLINSKKELLENKNDKWSKREDEYSITVTGNDVLSLISSWTGIPLEKLEVNESEKLLNLEENIHEKIIGQNDAVSAVSRAIRRSRTGLRSSNRPIGSFIFAGPTGVGKTELAKSLAEYIFGGLSNLIRIDMSEYMEKHAVSRLIGSPPGYVGFEQGGQLSEKIRRKPYSVILFDEIEKAHPEFFNILLQILEEGELTDNTGRTVSFRNTIVIMTSNIGNSRFDKESKLGFTEEEGEDPKKEMILDAVKNNFNPEFINRIDEVIYFHHLSEENIKEIVELELEKFIERASENGFNINVTSKALNFISEKCYSKKYGARFVHRIIRETVEDNLSIKILSGEIIPGNISLSVKKNEIYFRQKKSHSTKSSNENLNKINQKAEIFQ